MNRWLALLIAVVVGAIVGYAIFLAFAGAVFGIAWLYVFGDDPWPEWSNYVLGAVLLLGGLACWFFCSRIIWLQLNRAK